MAMNAGIWIDSEHAMIVYSNELDRKIEKVKASPAVELKTAATKPTYTKNDFVAEDRLKRKSTAVRTSFYRELAKRLKNVGRLLIIGPGTAKKEFAKHLVAERSTPIAVEIGSSGKMTDRQFIAIVDDRFPTEKTKKAPPRRKRSSVRSSIG